MADCWHCLTCLLPQHIRVHRHNTPAEEGQPFGRDRRSTFLLQGGCCFGLLGEEDEPRCQHGRVDRLSGEPRDFPSKQLARELDGDPSAVAGLRVSIDCPAVGQIDDCLECVGNNAVTGYAGEVGDKACPARVVLVLWSIQWRLCQVRVVALHCCSLPYVLLIWSEPAPVRLR